MGKVVGDLGATMSSALLVLGDRLGLYKAMAAFGPITAAELARRTKTDERYVGEWLNAQAASGYVTLPTWIAGASRLRRAAETPFKLILEARP